MLTNDVNNQQVVNGKKDLSKKRLWIGLGLSALSGVLLAATMPGYLNLGLIGWVALVPMLLAIELLPDVRPRLLALPFALIWSIAVHNWYASIFNPLLGYLMLIGAGAWYSIIISLGINLQRRLPGSLKLIALPVVWSALEFGKFIAPIVSEWWFVLLAKSQWGFPPALQVLSLTGFPGLSFLLMLSNLALAFFILKVWQKRKIYWPGLCALVFVTVVLAWGTVIIPTQPTDTFSIASTVDQANQPEIQSLSNMPTEKEGYYADTPEMSQAIFDVNAALTRQVAKQKVAFVVWPENEFADAKDGKFTRQLGALARETGAYIITDMVWRSPTGMHDTAVMVAPDGNEAGRRAKTHLFPGEKKFGFVPGPPGFPVFNTPHGKVGLGVCYDYHFLDVVKGLARNGADIMLMPTDDDMHQNRLFPYYHATDAVFRAVEHRVTFATAGTNGVSIIVDPYGRIIAKSGVNERTVITGTTFTVPDRTLYTRIGDWFGWLMILATAVLVGIAFFQRNRRKSH